MNGVDRARILEETRNMLRETLQLKSAEHLTVETPLLGSIPELDSMAVVTVIAAIEDRFGFVIEDDEISAETFSTVGTLVDFVEAKANS